jgi:hypothetical protein
MVIDYKWLNHCTQPIQGAMPLLETELSQVSGSKYFFSADFLKGFWQIPIHKNSQEYFSFMTRNGVYSPTRIPQGAMDSPLFFQSQLSLIFHDLMDEKKMLLWIDDVLIHAKTWEEYIILVDRFFNRCAEYHLQVSVKKTTFVDLKTTFCGRTITGTGVTYRPRNFETFLNMIEPTEAGQLSSFLMGINWMRDSILNTSAESSFTSIAAPLWRLLENVYTKAKSRKKAYFQHVKLKDVGWTKEHTTAFTNLKRKLADSCIENAFIKPNAKICIFTDASNRFHASMITQVAAEDWNEIKDVSELKHTPVACSSGEFKGSQYRWRMIEKEAYPLILALEEWEYILLTPSGIHVYGDHKNLITLYHPERISPPLTAGAEHRVTNWLHLLSKYKVNILKHIAGEKNLWTDLLSRWANPNFVNNATPSAVVRVNAIKTQQGKRKRASSIKQPKPRQGNYEHSEILSTSLRLQYDYGNPITELPSHSIILVAQANITEAEKLWCSQHEQHFDLDQHGLRRYKGKIWLPPSNTELLVRFCIGAHCGVESGHTEPGHRGLHTTLSYLKESFWWERMDEFVRKFLDSCLCCLKDKVTGDIIPRPHANHIFDDPENCKAGKVLALDFMHVRPLDPSSEHPFVWILVMKDVFSDKIELIPCESTTSDVVATAISWWIARFQKPQYLLTDQGSHFTAGIIDELAKMYDVKHHFTTAYCPWSHGCIENVIRDLRILLRVVLRSAKQPFHKWPYYLPSVMGIMNQTPSETLGGLSPNRVFMGLEQYNPLHVIYNPTTPSISTVDYSSSSIFDGKTLSQYVTQLQQSLHDFHNIASRAKTLRRDRNVRYHNNQNALLTFRARELGIRVSDLKPEHLLPSFIPGDFVLVATPKKPSTPKLPAVWRGPYRVLRAVSSHVYEVEHLVTQKILPAHICRLRFYADSHLDLPLMLLDSLNFENSMFDTFTVDTICGHRWSESLNSYEFYVSWLGFSEYDNSWIEFTQLHEDVPTLVSRYIDTLSASHPDRAVLVRLLRKC